MYFTHLKYPYFTDDGTIDSGYQTQLSVVGNSTAPLQVGIFVRRPKVLKGEIRFTHFLKAIIIPIYRGILNLVCVENK